MSLPEMLLDGTPPEFVRREDLDVQSIGLWRGKYCARERTRGLAPSGIAFRYILSVFYH
jgi:hypothetical protein